MKTLPDNIIDSFDLKWVRKSVSLAIEQMISDPKKQGTHYSRHVMDEENVYEIVVGATDQLFLSNMINLFNVCEYFEDYYIGNNTYDMDALPVMKDLLTRTERAMNAALGLKLDSLTFSYYMPNTGNRALYLTIAYEDLDTAKENLIRLNNYEWDKAEEDLEQVMIQYKVLKDRTYELIERLSRQSKHLPVNEYTVNPKFRSFYTDMILFGAWVHDRLMGKKMPPEKKPYASLTYKINRIMDKLTE